MGIEGFPGQGSRRSKQLEQTPEDVLVALKHRTEALPAPVAAADEIAAVGEEAGYDLKQHERAALRQALEPLLENSNGK